MPNPLHIELLDGPLAGRVHEVNTGIGLPVAFGLYDEEHGDGVMHWYAPVRNSGQPMARYLQPEPPHGMNVPEKRP